ncbi:hypothetical protein HDV64DRAFT_207313 [Trichoderma sp. TUCIM 5745]
MPTYFFIFYFSSVKFSPPGRSATVQYASIHSDFARGSCLKGRPAMIGRTAVLPSITTFISDRRPPAAHFRKRLTQAPGQGVSPGSSLRFATGSSNLAIPRPRRDPVRHGLFCPWP